MSLVNIHIHNPEVSVPMMGILKDIKELLIVNNQNQTKMSQALEDLKREVSEQKTINQSAITLIKEIKAKLDAAGTDEAALAALSADLDAGQQELATAITENTPQAGQAGTTPPATGTGDGTTP